VITRRCLLAGFAAALAPLGSAAKAQESKAGKVPRVGYVTSEIRSANVDAFEQGLREKGYVIGQNLMVEYRFGEGRVDRIPALVDELLRLGVDVLLAASPYVIRAAKQATSTVPIVGIDLETDPMEVGWVKSFARPGGNLTGFFLDIPELGGKQLQLLSETVPRLQRVAVLWDARVAGSQFKATESAAQRAKVGLQSLAFHQPDEFAAALEAARNQQAQAVVLLSSPSVFIHRKRLADLALQHRLPAICIFPQFADAGGLMGYGPNLPDLFRRAADYVDRIVKGAKPADLPIQRPLVFKLALNLRTARTLGLKIPQSLLGRADEVIQ
jgi:putative tryptophan/tyrosine transport system substrate-binding protein